LVLNRVFWVSNRLIKNGAQHEQLMKNILEATKDGPLVEWADRLAKLAEEASVDIADICWWGSSAKSIALHIISHVESRGTLSELEAAIKKRLG
jgi:hypothetical protein